jgi:hypothetical protein
MAIRAVARCAIKLDSSADKCVKILVEIISNNQDLAVSQEGIAVMKGERLFFFRAHVLISVFQLLL